MKKLFAFILVLTLVLSMASVAFATEVEPMHGGWPPKPTPKPKYEDKSSVPITKVFKLENEDTINREETFEFNIESHAVSDSVLTKDQIPLPTFRDRNNKISFNAGEAKKEGTSKSITLDLPTYEHVGIYIYKITEISGNTADVVYDSNVIYLKVTVIEQDGAKVRIPVIRYNKPNSGPKSQEGTFTNVFRAGKLAITKKVTGNMGEDGREFKVTVTLNAPKNKDLPTVTYSGGSYEQQQTVDFGKNNQAKVEIYLKHGHTVTFNNLPYGTTFTVKEDDYTKNPYNYEQAKYDYIDDKWKEIKKIDDNLETVIITNKKEKVVDTGINLDSLPYILILTVAIGGLTLFVVRRRLSIIE